MLDHGRVIAAHRVDLGNRDGDRGAGTTLLADAVTRLMQQLHAAPAARPVLPAAIRRGLVLVGDGATKPDLTAHLVNSLRMSVHCADSPRSAAINGAGLAALAALRHPAAT